MAQQYPYTALVEVAANGTVVDSIVIQDGAGGLTDFPLQEDDWAPDAVERRPGKLGGQSPYEDGIETIPLGATGDTPAAALAGAGKLKRFLDQADRWSDQEDVDPIRLRLKLQGSTVPGYLQALLLGRKGKDGNPDGNRVLQLPVGYSNQAGLRSYIKRITATIKHRLWVMTSDGYTENYVSNASFELNGAAVTTNWTDLNSPGAGTAAGVFPNGQVHGFASLRVQNTSSTAYRGKYQDVTGLTTGASYRVSVYVTPAIGTMRLVAYDGGGTSNAVEIASTGTDNQRLELTKVAPASGIRIALIAHTAGADGYFDAAMIEVLPWDNVAGTFRMKSTEALTVTGASQTNGARMWAHLPDDLPTTSPVKLSISGFDLAQGDLGAGFLLVAKEANWINTIEAESMATGAFVSVGSPTEPATTLASGGSILRYTPVVTTEVSTAAVALGGTPGKRLAVFAVVRNNSAARSYQISATLEAWGPVSAIESATTGKKTADGAVSGTNPQVIALGEVVLRNTAARIKLNVTASATGSTLDIDRVVVLTLDDEDTSRAIALGAFSFAPLGVGGAIPLVVDHNILDSLDPEIYFSTGGATYYLPAPQGDPFLNMVGQSVYALLLLPGGDTSTCWRNDQAGVATSHALTITRSPAYLIPE